MGATVCRAGRGPDGNGLTSLPHLRADGEPVRVPGSGCAEPADHEPARSPRVDPRIAAAARGVFHWPQYLVQWVGAHGGISRCRFFQAQGDPGWRHGRATRCRSILETDHRCNDCSGLRPDGGVAGGHRQSDERRRVHRIDRLTLTIHRRRD